MLVGAILYHPIPEIMFFIHFLSGIRNRKNDPEYASKEFKKAKKWLIISIIHIIIVGLLFLYFRANWGTEEF
jgi:putative copper export protein